jgi:hypothetical protein
MPHCHQIEHFHTNHTGSYAKYADPDPQAHSNSRGMERNQECYQDSLVDVYQFR